MTSLQHEIRQNRPFASLEQEVFLNLVRTTGILEAPLRSLLHGEGLRPSHYNILRILRGQDGGCLSCSAIGERMVTRVPDVTRLVEKLAAKGLVERRRCPEDGRKVLVSLTGAGAAVLGRLEEPVNRLHASSLAHMSEKELLLLVSLLTKARLGGGAE